MYRVFYAMLNPSNKQWQFMLMCALVITVAREDPTSALYSSHRVFYVSSKIVGFFKFVTFYEIHFPSSSYA